MSDHWKNKLFFGDNLRIMREYISGESVDLIYLDPPFNSKASYNVLFAEKNGTQSSSQVTAFEDTWHWGLESEEAYRELVQEGPTKLSELIQAFRSFLGQNDMMAYLVMMAIRLVEMHRALKPTGTIYLHCDPTASHYLKLVMDAVFGVRSFRNEIIWKRTPFAGSSKARAMQYPRSHDVILFYSRSNDGWTWNGPTKPYSPEYLARFKWDDNDGRGPYRKTLLKTYSKDTFERLKKDNRLVAPTRTGASWSYKQYLAESSGGVQVDDIWMDLNALNPVAAERLGYPTQKPEALLERILEASSNEGDVVMDPFCGCGTTIAVAQRLKRKWIGIDITHLAITLMKHRLEDTFGTELSDYEVIGDPKDLPGAKALAEHDRYQFEWWALGKVAARPAQDKKKGADKGIDGLIYFIDNTEGKAQKIIVQVKSGNIKRGDIATLKGDVDREKAAIGVFITLQKPTRPMKEEAVSAGFYEPEQFPGKHYPKIQVLTIEELLDGRQVEYPRVAPEVTFKKAERKKKKGRQEQLF